MEFQMKKYLVLLFVPLFLFGQEITPNTITIDASASISAPAELIRFMIHLSSESDSAQHAFRNHRNLEKKIVNIIKRYKIDSSDVSHSLLSIRKKQNKEGKTIFQTTQNVHLNLYDIDNYYEFQITLLSHDLNQFSARLSVKNEKDLIERGYEKALKIATTEAQLLADKINRKLGTVSAIISRSYADEVYEFSATPRRIPQGGLLDINKIVSKQINLKIMFELI
jgi:uncharacterized protein YggE